MAVSLNKQIVSEQTVVIRPARMFDAPGMVDYMAALIAERLDTISVRICPSLEDEREWVLRTEISERMLILLAVHGEEVVGMLDLSAGERPDNRHTGRFGMSIAKRWRERGVGRSLLSAAIAAAREWPGFCRIELECVAWNAAGIRLYESLGFVIEARKTKAVNLRGRPEDMLLMALTW
jgi:RimJ/RimL family protein N-acetyltransferase